MFIEIESVSMSSPRLAKSKPRSAPCFGRFVQPDPLGYEEGANLYGYAGVDPINNKDTSGLASICIEDFSCEKIQADLRFQQSFGIQDCYRIGGCSPDNRDHPAFPFTFQGVAENLGRGIRDGVVSAINYGRACVGGLGSVSPHDVGRAASAGALKGAATGAGRGFIIGSRLGPAGSGWGATGGAVGGVISGAIEGVAVTVVTQACRAGNR